MKTSSPDFPDPSRPDDGNSDHHHQSPFRAPRPGEGKWDNPQPRSIPRQRDLGRHDSTPPQEIVDLWNTPPEPPVPKDNYFSVITRAHEDKANSGTPYYALVFQITHGPYAGRCFEYRLWLTRKALTHTKACAAKFGIYHVEKLYKAKLTGRPCMIFIDAKKDGSPETEIKCFDPIQLPTIDGEGGGRCGAD